MREPVWRQAEGHSAVCDEGSCSHWQAHRFDALCAHTRGRPYVSLEREAVRRSEQRCERAVGARGKSRLGEHAGCASYLNGFPYGRRRGNQIRPGPALRCAGASSAASKLLKRTGGLRTLVKITYLACTSVPPDSGAAGTE